MPICNSCHYCDFQPAPGEFTEITEAMIMEDLEDPAEIAESIEESAGLLMCPECGSTDVLTE